MMRSNPAADEFGKRRDVTGARRRIRRKRQRPARALRAAQLKLAKKRSPADWAGFVLQGEWK